MSFKVKAVFYDHKIEERDKKDGSGKFTAGDAIFELDNSYINKKDNQTVLKMDLVPFNVFGKTAEKCMELTRGEEVEITFGLEGTEYQDKNYPRIKGIFVNRIHETKGQDQPEKKRDDDIPF